MFCIKKPVLLLLLTILPIFGSILTEDAASVGASLRRLGLNDGSIIESTTANFDFLTTAADTKSGHRFYRLTSALLMTGEKVAIHLHDLLLVHSLKCNDSLVSLIGLHFDLGLKLDAADKHMISARFKSNGLIFDNTGIELPDPLKGIEAQWQCYQKPLAESLSERQRSALDTPKGLGDIIQCVLIPDTLIMGAHPLQKSVSKERPGIAFNPRVQFFDQSWSAEDVEISTLPPHQADDYRHRCFSMNYAPYERDPDAKGQKAKLREFILSRLGQYNRMIFDLSTLCGVALDNFIELSYLLKEDCHIYSYENGYILDYWWQYHNKSKTIQGDKDKGSINTGGGNTIDYARQATISDDHDDAWFLSQARHPVDEKNEMASSLYYRIRKTVL